MGNVRGMEDRVMSGKLQVRRVVRWLMIVGASGLLPAFVMRCDKAALNFQRGLFEGLGGSVGDFIVSQGLPAVGA